MPKLPIFAAALVTFGLLTASDVRAEDSEQVYQFYCAQCHGATGKGDGPNVTKDMPVTPRNFTNGAEMSKLTDDDMRNVIKDGGPAVSKSPIMPPWSQTITDAETEGLVAYLRVMCNCKGK
ncbi:MAG: cytochrome c [Magnetococcales bacterium]|nr:cytochrome c [Magnetococcales bacterium]